MGDQKLLNSHVIPDGRFVIAAGTVVVVPTVATQPSGREDLLRIDRVFTRSSAQPQVNLVVHVPQPDDGRVRIDQLPVQISTGLDEMIGTLGTGEKVAHVVAHSKQNSMLGSIGGHLETIVTEFLYGQHVEQQPQRARIASVAFLTAATAQIRLRSRQKAFTSGSEDGLDRGDGQVGLTSFVVRPLGDSFQETSRVFIVVGKVFVQNGRESGQRFDLIAVE